ncbi:hypothetical protein [Nannocystis pusilla]|uniref:hypothetical protein n=1 Tax=Nannocystis pusilla TaxID=889268 RepID=UPI003BF0D52F
MATAARTAKTRTNRARSNCEVDSLDALAAQAPAEAIELPLAALRRTIERDGWSFVGGRLLEFEGNHNDTLIYARLASR